MQTYGGLDLGNDDGRKDRDEEEREHLRGRGCQRSVRFDGRREELTLYCKSATEFPRFKKVRETQRPMEMWLNTARESVSAQITPAKAKGAHSE